MCEAQKSARHRAISISWWSTSIRSRRPSRPARLSTTASRTSTSAGRRMIRAAAKNHDYVAVLHRAGATMAAVARRDDREQGRPRCPGAPQAPGGQGLCAHRRLRRGDLALVRRASWARSPRRASAFAGTPRQTLRYGENPHQEAAFYPHRREPRPGVATARQLQGKELTYNNINDTDAAFELVAEFDPKQRRRSPSSSTPTPAASATARSLREAYERRAGLRSGLGLRRHHRPEPRARRGRPPRRSPRSSPRWSSRPRPTTEALAVLAQPRRTCACW